jgi:type I restriction enzyme, S subunit
MTFTGLANQGDSMQSAQRLTPSHWEWSRLKNIARINQRSLTEDTAPDFEFDYIDVGTVSPDGGIGIPERLVFEDAPSRARRLVLPGDTIVSTVRTYLRAIAYITEEYEDCVVSTGFASITPDSTIDSRFLFWWIRSTNCLDEIVSRSVGVSYPAVNPSDIGDVAIVVPPLHEQHRIMEFVEAETSHLDDLVDEQRQLLGLLAEHRFAAMSKTVCSRVGGEVGDLQSGLTDLPDEWVMTRLGAVATIQTGLTLGRTFNEETNAFPYLRVANVQDGRIDITEMATIELPESIARRHLLRPGDVLMTEANGNPDNIGRGAVWDGSIHPCLHQNHVFALRPDRTSLMPEFLALCMGSAWGRAYFRATSTQVGIASTNASKIRRFPLPLPTVLVQNEVLSEFHSLVGRIGELEAEVHQQIRLLLEHRQALITAAVTGQLDVIRSVA